jgi:hypothetical protein
MTRDFLEDMAERAVRAFAWAFTSSLVVGEGFNAFTDINWLESGGVGLGAALLSVLASIYAGRRDPRGTASMTRAVVPTHYADAIARGRRASGLTDGPA